MLLSTVKALYFTWDLFCKFRKIKYHAYIFSAQTFWQYIITMINVTISCRTALSVTRIVVPVLNALRVKSMRPKCSTRIGV